MATSAAPRNSIGDRASPRSVRLTRRCARCFVGAPLSEFVCLDGDGRSVLTSDRYPRLARYTFECQRCQREFWSRLSRPEPEPRPASRPEPQSPQLELPFKPRRPRRTVVA